MKNKLKYFFENHPHNVVYATSDETLFINQEDAVKHAQTLKDNVVEEYLRTSVKEEPVIPDPKLSAAQIQEMIKTKQLELDVENQGEGETSDTEKLEGEEQSEGEQSQENNQEENQSE